MLAAVSFSYLRVKTFAIFGIVAVKSAMHRTKGI